MNLIKSENKDLLFTLLTKVIKTFITLQNKDIFYENNFRKIFGCFHSRLFYEKKLWILIKFNCNEINFNEFKLFGGGPRHSFILCGIHFFYVFKEINPPAEVTIDICSL